MSGGSEGLTGFTSIFYVTTEAEISRRGRKNEVNVSNVVGSVSPSLGEPPY
jgi:hypothetical protein